MIPRPSGHVSAGAAHSTNAIFTGAKPAVLTLDGATIIQMLVNLKLANALVIALPTAILVPAAKEIE
jgi:ABC-type uncharacterized transport system substrate-binding protein